MTVNITDFTTYVRNVAGMNTTVLPANDPGILAAYNMAIDLTPDVLLDISDLQYTTAVYNYGVSYLINWQNDQTGQTYFTNLRQTLGINSFTGGVVDSSGDQGTNMHMDMADFIKNLNMGSLQLLKDPFGRAFLAACQRIGTFWDIS